ncbi:MAG: hypothetical protein HY210_03280 [Candidatus Omnitrophica bacterium]|nr:hypothetical protein [Candidatus Omnitrophota bacterium]
MFRPGDVDHLLEKIQWMVSPQDHRPAMQENIRQVYATSYSAHKNYEMLIDIYKKAVSRKSTKAKAVFI